MGGQAKRASITGAAYVVTPRESFGRGRSGSFDLFVSNDREEFILGALSGDDTSAWRLAAHVVIGSAAEGEQVTLTLEPGSPAQADLDDVMKEAIMAFLSALPPDHKGAGVNMLRKGVRCTNSHKDQALEELVAEGYVTREPVGGHTAPVRPTVHAVRGRSMTPLETPSNRAGPRPSYLEGSARYIGAAA